MLDGCMRRLSEFIKGAWKASWSEGARDVAHALNKVAGRLMVYDQNMVGDLEKKLKKTKNDLKRCMQWSVTQGKVEEQRGLEWMLREMRHTKWKQRGHVWWLEDWDQSKKRRTEIGTRSLALACIEEEKHNRVKELRREDSSVVAAGSKFFDHCGDGGALPTRVHGSAHGVGRDSEERRGHELDVCRVASQRRHHRGVLHRSTWRVELGQRCLERVHGAWRREQ